MVDFEKLLREEREKKAKPSDDAKPVGGYVRGYLDIEARYDSHGPYACKPDEKPNPLMFRDWSNWHPYMVGLVKVRNQQQSNIQLICPHCTVEDHFLRVRMERSIGGSDLKPARYIDLLNLQNLVKYLTGNPLGQVNELWTYNGRMRPTEWDKENPYIVKGADYKPTGERIVRIGLDIGVLYYSFGLDLELARPMRTRDLCVALWQKGIYGGLKVIEAEYGKDRPADDITRGDEDCVALWEQYRNDPEANFPILIKLLNYNMADCDSLAYLERGLREGEIG